MKNVMKDPHKMNPRVDAHVDAGKRNRQYSIENHVIMDVFVDALARQVTKRPTATAVIPTVTNVRAVHVLLRFGVSKIETCYTLNSRVIVSNISLSVNIFTQTFVSNTPDFLVWYTAQGSACLHLRLFQNVSYFWCYRSVFFHDSRNNIKSCKNVLSLLSY